MNLPVFDPQHEEISSAARGQIVVVGAGPVGFRFVQELRKRDATRPLLLIGNEPYPPYDRVRLSALLAGETTAPGLNLPLDSFQSDPNFRYLNSEVTTIDSEHKVITDRSGQQYPYAILVLATGSRAHIPNIEGTKLSGVYSFRNMRDTEQLKARACRARQLVVVGGGLLGLEAARALQQSHTQVTIVQQAPQLMNQQLDVPAATLLQNAIEALGIRVITNSGVRQILGTERVSGVVLRSGETLECDTVLLSAGIKPNMELARSNWISVGRGIRVDDRLCSSVQDIYAIGECAEHRGKIYGLVAPGLEQAAVAADTICGGQSRYIGSSSVARLKVVGVPVLSLGEVQDSDNPARTTSLCFRRRDDRYRKIILRRGRVIGALGVGDWDEAPRIQEMVIQQRYLLPWQRLLFCLTGRLGSAGNNIQQWPAASIICNCNNVTRGQLSDAITTGCGSITALATATGASTTCGSCKPLLQLMLGNKASAQPEPGRPLLVATAALAMILTLLILLLPELSVSDSVQHPNLLEHIWNDGLFKQITGFTLLGATLIGLLMSLRKRVSAFKFATFSLWRNLHLVLAVLSLALLSLHTGLNLGANLNFWLLANFSALALAGALAGLCIAQQHHFAPATGQRLRSLSFWTHLLLSWPLPGLLGFHILSVYYF